MSFHTHISDLGAGQTSLSAHFLLTRPVTRDIESITALFMAAIGETGANLKSARKWFDGSKLALQMSDQTAMMAVSDIPLSAHNFRRALPPFCPAALRASKMSIIQHHEGFITLRLRHVPSKTEAISALFLRAVIKIAGTLPLSGLLWVPTGQLHQASDIPGFCTLKTSLNLLLNAEYKTTGPRHLPIVEFSGAGDVLGFELSLHLMDLERSFAVEAGLAFAAAARTNPLLRRGSGFTHQDTHFRIAHSDDYASRVTLIPVQRTRILTVVNPY